MQLESLFKRTKTGAVQVCNISTSADTFTVEFGQLEGKMQTKDTPCFGKNIGKANETTPEAQAVLEAKAKWLKKVKSGYSTNKCAPETVALPQKVKPYLDNKAAIVYPAYSTPKLNGINGTYWLMADDTLKLTSRGGDEYPPIPHLEANVRLDMIIAGTNCLNGELYIHGEHLQDITSAVRKPKELSSKLRFCVFELPRIHKKYETKVETLRKLSDSVEITEVTSEEEADLCYKNAMAEKYEGTVLYNKHAVYKFNERSSNVYKYKKTIDAEFEIVGFNVDKNGEVVWSLVTQEGKEFKAKPKGSREYRQSLATYGHKHIGEWWTVEYEMLSKASVPLKPVAICQRDCCPEGKPTV